MSTNWTQDLNDMHVKFGFPEWVKENKSNKEYMLKMLEFRLNFLYEELKETDIAVHAADPEEIVDGLIDLCVVAIGTLDLFEIDGQKAWEAVNDANMAKNRGIKHNRPNPLGLPDLMKPEGWVGPTHKGNHGLLTDVFSDDI